MGIICERKFFANYSSQLFLIREKTFMNISFLVQLRAPPHATPIFPMKVAIVEAVRTNAVAIADTCTHLQLLDRVVLPKHSNTGVLNIQLEHDCA